MQPKIQQLKNIEAEITDLKNAMAVLSWDQRTYMPEGAAEARSNQLATLARLIHIKSTAAEYGQLLHDLKTGLSDQDQVGCKAVFPGCIGGITCCRHGRLLDF